MSEETAYPKEILPKTAMVTNNHMKLFASSAGHIAIENGGGIPSFSSDRLEGGVCLSVYIDGDILGTVPLGKTSDGFSSVFAFEPRADVLIYRAWHEKEARKYEVTLRWYVSAFDAQCVIVCDVRGMYEKAYAELSWCSKEREDEAFVWGAAVSPSPICGFASDMCIRTPACRLKSGALTPKRHTAIFRLGASEDEDELFDMLSASRHSRRLQKRKMGELLQKQACAAGLSRSVFARERDFLQRLLFRKKCRIDAMDAEILENMAVYAENPIVIARGFSSDSRESVRELLRLFKFMCIRGVRYDLVILGRGSHADAVDMITEEIRFAGCENLRSWACGVIFADIERLTEDAYMLLIRSSCMILDREEKTT